MWYVHYNHLADNQWHFGEKIKSPVMQAVDFRRGFIKLVFEKDFVSSLNLYVREIVKFLVQV